MQLTRRTLSDSWRFREIPRPRVPIHNQLPWLPAQVPGHVHLDLVKNGVIPDPFVGFYEKDAQWVDESDWVYETEFMVDALPEGESYLVFNGLDTVAEIALNGQPLGATDNMFIPHEFSVQGKLNVGTGDAGKNQLQITFRSATRIGTERHDRWDADGHVTIPWHWDNWGAREFVRKAQYMFGWDWGPVLPSCGIWRPIELVTVPVARLLDWNYTVEFTGDSALVHVTAFVERASAQASTPLTFSAGVANAQTVSAPVPTGSGRHAVAATLTIPNPIRWEPAGTVREHGDPKPHLYTLDLTINGSETVEHRAAKIGLRTIELLHEPDADGQGEGFTFLVNGEKVFMKGANWIPADSFPTRLTQDVNLDPKIEGDNRVEQLVKMAVDCGMNMLRIWGGGFYESEHFYDLCDQHGILVWQDFPYGCGYYPDTDEYAAAGRTEAVQALRRIRVHPSLALLCGNNENQTMFEGNWTGTRPSYLLGDHLYHEILPAAVASECPQIPYWPGSPFGGPDANSPNFGDRHNWDVWHGIGDWVNYANDDCRFCSEFGFASACGMAAWQSCVDVETENAYTPAVRWHDKTRKGYPKYLGMVELHYPRPESLEDLVYYTQINQAEALKFGIEHYRRIKGRNWGTLFWQINDCWPVQSWAVIDSLLEPKAAYFWMKKFHAPVLVSLVREGSEVRAHLSNDQFTEVSGELTLSLKTFAGETLSSATSPVAISENATGIVGVFDLAPSASREHETYVHAKFTSGGIMSENLLLLGEPKALTLTDPDIAISVTDGGAAWEISVTSKSFAPYVWLRLVGDPALPGDKNFSDNFFHLVGGETKAVRLPKPPQYASAGEVEAALIVRTLAG